MTELKANIKVSLIDRVTGPAHEVSRSLGKIANISSGFGKLKKSATQVGDSLENVAKASGKLLLIGGAAAWAFKSQFIDTAAQFEKFKTILETVEGSSEAAGRSMGWVSDFAVTTPYELDEVMEAFVRLRSYGIDPVNGMLRTLGDTSSAMGKPLMQSVEAIADAVTGEYERLKEFGITSSTSGSRTKFAYTDKAGKAQQKVVNNKDREQIRLALKAIWDEKYAGAMDKLSRSWGGMMSNLSDQWTRFKMLVMNAGVFDFLKNKLKGVLDAMDRLAASGEMKKWAERIATELKAGLAQAWEAAKGFAEVLKGVGSVLSWVAEKMGGFHNLGVVLAGLMAGSLLVSIAGLISSLVSFGATCVGVASSLAAAAGVTTATAGATGAAATVAGTVVGTTAATTAATTTGTAAITTVAPVVLAAAGGYIVGTGINAGINKIDAAFETRIGNAIGEAVAKSLAFFGNREARVAIEINNKASNNIDAQIRRGTRMILP